MDTIINVFGDKANLIWGGVVGGLTYIFGGHWAIFVLFLVLNVVDYVYGVLKAMATNTMSSAKGAKGVVKKVSYWVVIALAFGLSCVFVEIGAAVGVDLGFLQLLGWFVLAIYIINEITSILENMVALGVDVPPILLRGLAAAKTAVDTAGNKVVPENGSGREDNGRS